MSAELRGSQSEKASALGKALGILDGNGIPRPGALVDPAKAVSDAFASDSANTSGSILEVLNDIADGVPSRDEGGARFAIDGSPVQLAVGAIDAAGRGVSPAEAAGVSVGVALGPLKVLEASGVEVTFDVEAWLLKVLPRKSGIEQFEPGLGLDLKFDLKATDATFPLEDASLRLRIDGTSAQDAKALLDLTLTPRAISADQDRHPFSVTPPPISLSWDLSQSQDVLSLVVAAALSLAQFLLATITREQATEVAGKTARKLLVLLGLIDSNYGSTNTALRLTPLELARLSTDADGALQTWLSANFADPSKARAWVGTVTSLATTADKPTVTSTGNVEWKSDMRLTEGINCGLLARRVTLGGRTWLRLGVYARTTDTAFSAAPTTGTNRDLKAVLDAEVAPFAIALDGAPALVVEERLSVGFTVSGAQDTTPVVTLTTPVQTLPPPPYAVKRVQLGLSLTPEVGFRLITEADVAVGGNTITVDALNHPELVVGTVAAATIADALNIDMVSLAAVLGAAVGLRKPPGAASTHPTITLAALTANPSGAYAVWLTTLQGSTPHMLSWLGALRTAIATATGWNNMAPVEGAGTEANPWVLPLCERSARAPVALHFVTRRGATADQAELRVALSVAPPALTLTTPGATAGAQAVPVARVVNRLSLGLLDANVSKNTNDPTVVRFAPRARSAWTVVHPTTGQDFSVTVSGTTKVQARQLDAMVSWDHALGLDADVALNTVKVVRGTETWLSYAKLSAADLVANAGSAVADLTKFASVGLALALWRWKPEAAGRALVFPRLLGQWPGTQAALSDAEVTTLFADPVQELARLFGRRLKEWDGPGRHPLLLLRDVLFGDTPDIGARDSIAVRGSGTWTDPWAVYLCRASTTIPVPLELLTWLDPAPGTGATHVGFGLRYTRTDTLNTLSLVEVARLDVVRVALTRGAPERGLASLPAASLSATLKSSDGWLLGGPTEAIRLAELTGSLTWQYGKKLDADLQLKDAAWDGVAADRLGWSDARTAPLLDALRSAPKAPLAAGGVAATLLITLGALGLDELDESGRTWALLREPMDDFLSKPGEFLSLRLRDPAADTLDLRALKDALTPPGAPANTDPWSWNLGGVTLSVSLGGWISLAASTLDYEFDLTLRPLDGQLRGTASIHPRVYGSASARLDLDFNTGPTAGSASAQEAARHLRVGLYGNDGTGTGLLGDGLELYPPERDLGVALVEVLGKVAGGLFVKLVVDGVLLPALASSEPDAARVLQILGVLDGDATRGYATSMGLVGALDDPFGWCLAADRLAALGELIKDRTFAEGRLRFRVSDSWNESSSRVEMMRARSMDRVVKAWIETATPFGAPGFAFDLSAGVQAFIPRGGTAPRRIEPVASARAAFTLGAGATPRTVATVLQVKGSDCTVDVVYSSGARAANVELRLFPWSGISGLLTSAAQPLIVAVLEQFWKEMTTSRNATASKIGAVIMATVAALDLKGPEGPYDIDPAKWAAFVGAPATRLDGIARDTGRGAAWAMCFAGLGMIMGLRTDASDGYGVIRLGGGFELVSGRYEVAADKMRFGAWLRLSTDGWPTGVPLRPTAWAADRSRVGFYLENGAVKPDVSLSMALGADLGARWVLDFILRARVTANGQLSLGVGLEDANSQDNALALEVTFVPELKVANAAGASKVGEDLLRTLILPLGMGILCTPALHDNLLLLKPDLDGDGTADLNLEFGTVLVAAGLLTLHPTAPRYRPRRITASWNLWDGALAAIGMVLESLSSSEVKLGAYRDESGADKRYGVELNGALKLLDDPGLRLGFGRSQSPPPSFPQELTRGARMRFQVLHKYGSEGWVFAPGLDIRGMNLFLTGENGDALIDEPASVVLQGFALTTDLAYVDSDGPKATRRYSFTDKNYGVLFHLGGLSFAGGAASSNSDLVSGLLPARAADNPGFSLTVGYRDEHARICFGDTPRDNVVWIDVQQQVGPMSLRRIGLGIAPKSGDTWNGGCLQLGREALSAHDLSLHYDGTFSLWGLRVEPWGMRLTMPLGTFYNPASWKLDLDGLGITYTSDVVTIAAGLYLKGNEFLGAGVLRAGDFALSALFAYKNDSFFGVASASLPIGGSPAFYIRRIAAGFGYNRAFQEPDNGEDVANHILVKVLEGSSDVALDLDDVHRQFDVENGSSWFAAGVGFTTFGIIEGTALVYVLFNDATTIGLMGKASLEIGTTDVKILTLNLGLTAQIVVSGDDPRVTVRADVLSGSHLLLPGFALHGSAYLGYWFKNGDFLLSVGGYHPDFVPRDYYPRDLSRLGFDLALGGVDLWGRMYFALTPREVMLGAELHARGEWGPLAAWLSVWVDVLLGWDPFYYNISAGVTLGGSLDLWIDTVEVEFSASIKVWGPPFGGRATLEILCIDVDVDFGEDKRATPPPALSADEFAERHLQLKGASPTTLQQVAQVNVLRGRSRVRGSSPENPAGTAEDPIRLDPSACLAVITRIPATEWKYGDRIWNNSAPEFGGDDTLDLAPCRINNLNSTISVSLRAGSGPLARPDDTRVLTRPFPRADWDTARPGNARDASQEDTTIPLMDRLQLDFRDSLAGRGTDTEFLPDPQDARLPLDARREIDPFVRPAAVTLPSGQRLVQNLYFPVVQTATAAPAQPAVPAPPAPRPRAPRVRPAPKLTPQAVARVRLPRRGTPSGPLAPAHRALVTHPENSRRALRQSLRASARALVGAAGITIPPDSCALYDLRPRGASQKRLGVSATSAPTGVRVVALDRGGRALSDTSLTAATSAPPGSLPAQVARLVFSTLPAPTAGSAIGFTANTPLIPVAGATWLAPGVVVRQLGVEGAPETDYRPQTAETALGGRRKLGLRLPGATGTVALLFTVDPAAALRSIEDLAEVADVRGWEMVRSPNGARVALLASIDKRAPWELVVSPKKPLTGAVLSPATVASLKATLQTDAPWAPVSDGAVTEGATLRLVEVS